MTPFYRKWNFDIDRYLDHLVPTPPWKHIPYPIARWFGYRKNKAEPTGNLMPIFWAFLGVFCAITIIEVTSQHIPSFQHHQTPIIVGSFGAAAVLEFYAIEAPLAQPRNAIGGQLISAFAGIVVAKLFRLSDRFDEYYYLGGALACASATALMALTKTVHPPAGATALLAVVDDRLVHLGWFLLPVMALGCGLMLCVALLVNNIERKFPIYWWTPNDLSGKPSIFRIRKNNVEDKVENGAAGEKVATVDTENGQTAKPASEKTDGDAEDNQEAQVAEAVRHHVHDQQEVIIRPGVVLAPEDMYLTQEEKQFLETLSKRL